MYRSIVTVAHNSEPTKKLAQRPIHTTLTNIPFEIWRAVQNEATDRRVSSKSIWIEAVCKYLDLKLPGAA